MNILHATPHISIPGSGLATAVLGLAGAQQQLNHRVAINSIDRDPPPANAPPLEFIRSKITGPAHFGFSPQGERWAASAAAGQYDVFHQHGLWPLFSRVTSVWRATHRKPTMVAPHGSLEPWALRQSRWKKWIATRAYERRNLREADCLQASAYAEIAGIRDFGLNNPVAVIPNGISPEWLALEGNADAFRRAHNLADDVRIALYLSRLHPVKGALALVDAFVAEKKHFPDWHLVLAGPIDDREYAARLRHAIIDQQLEDRVHLIGTLSLQEKRDAMAAAEIFVLPTLSDNFAIVIAEALGAGVPVLTTQGAIAWESIEQHACGWRIALGSEHLRLGLRHALEQPANVLTEMGGRGLQLVRKQFLWTHAAARSLEVYKWLLGQGGKPACVYD